MLAFIFRTALTGLLLGSITSCAILLVYPFFLGSGQEWICALLGCSTAFGVLVGPVCLLQSRRKESGSTRSRPLLLLTAVGVLASGVLFSIGSANREWRVAPRVLVFGIDGAGWNVIEPMIERGELPNLERLMKEGTYGSLKSFEPTFSPIIWTSIGTGVTAETHGIDSFYATQDQLRSKRVWEVLDESDVRVGVFRWWATWPPREVNGFIIPDILARDSRAWPPAYNFVNQIRIDEKSGKRRRPIDYLGTLSDFLDCGLRLDDAWSMAGALAEAWIKSDSKLFHSAKRRSEILLNGAAYGNLLRRFEPEFTAFYDNGVDVHSHYYWKFFESEVFPDVTAEEAAAYGDLIPSSYRVTDHVLGRILEHLDPSTTVIVVSDHGLRARDAITEQRPQPLVQGMIADMNLGGEYYGITLGTRTFVESVKTDAAEKKASIERVAERLGAMHVVGRPDPLFRIFRWPNGRIELFVTDAPLEIEDRIQDGEELVELGRWMTLQPGRSGTHSLDAIFIGRGPGIRKKHHLEPEKSVLDVAPTLLYLMGAAVAENLDGSILLDAIGPTFLRENPIEWIDEYGNYEPTAGELTVDEETMDQLRAIGYVR